MNRNAMMTSSDDLDLARSLVGDMATVDLDFFNDDSAYDIMVTVTGDRAKHNKVVRLMKKNGYEMVERDVEIAVKPTYTGTYYFA